MASRKLEEQLEQIQLLRNALPNPETISILRKALTDRSNLVVAKAAQAAGEIHAVDLIPDLLAAYSRLFENSVKTDPKCRGKMAIIKSLTVLDYSESAPYVRGSTHVQMEPVWGGQEDAAGPLRSDCILALPQCSDIHRSEVFRRLVDSLFDPLDPVRMEAVRTIEQMSGDEAPLLLRLKARVGDRRPAVTGQAFDAILNLESETGLGFVAAFLKSEDPEVRDEAALAMGQFRHAKAVGILIAAWRDTMDRDFRSVLLRAISVSREESALEFLLSLVREGPGWKATAALEALELHSGSPEIQTRIAAARNERIPE
jgi:HEAT repeat protein